MNIEDKLNGRENMGRLWCSFLISELKEAESESYTLPPLEGARTRMELAEIRKDIEEQFPEDYRELEKQNTNWLNLKFKNENKKKQNKKN